MRLISLVPSWTETLIEAGLHVVGRTRYCIHPREEVAGIPIVGGTKQVDWEKVRSLRPDLILLDQEENPKSFTEAAPCPWLATHVTDLPALERELGRLAQALSSPRLGNLQERLRKVLRSPLDPTKVPVAGLLERWGDWDLAQDECVYVIWKNPWMTADLSTTYIGSVLRHLGYQGPREASVQKYPTIDEAQLQKRVGLFSSEPFPFSTKLDEIKAICPRGAMVDGEAFSWFGVRSLRFLESLVIQAPSDHIS